MYVIFGFFQLCVYSTLINYTDWIFCEIPCSREEENVVVYAIYSTYISKYALRIMCFELKITYSWVGYRCKQIEFHKWFIQILRENFKSMCGSVHYFIEQNDWKEIDILSKKNVFQIRYIYILIVNKMYHFGREFN